MKAKNTIDHRDRKNGYGREEWQKRKHAANAARPKQLVVTFKNEVREKTFHIRDNSPIKRETCLGN